MTEESLIEIVQFFLNTTALLSAPLIITVVAVGIITNILQSVTQMKDQALSFVPKVIVAGIVFLLTIPWYIQVAQHFTETIFALMERTTM